MSVEKAKELILDQLNKSPNGIVLLNEIYPMCLRYEITREEGKFVSEELQKAGFIKIEDLRGMF